MIKPRKLPEVPHGKLPRGLIQEVGLLSPKMTIEVSLIHFP